jgi:3-(3-hydroxy-phenyl)propionate hydroxylase
MRDAFNLAWKLALVIKGKAGDALLDTTSRNAATTPKR